MNKPDDYIPRIGAQGPQGEVGVDPASGFQGETNDAAPWVNPYEMMLGQKSGWQLCPKCIDWPANARAYGVCPVCKNKQIISIATGLPPADSFESGGSLTYKKVVEIMECYNKMTKQEIDEALSEIFPTYTRQEHDKNH